jgi:hypothetical protein
MQAGFTVLPSDGLNLRLIERKIWHEINKIY